MKQRWFDDEIARYKRQPILLTILSASEVAAILDHTRNVHRWMIIATLYATALRLNALRLLEVSGIDSQRMALHVRKGRGRIPRPRALAGAARTVRAYYRWRKPKPVAVSIET